jgi:nucleoside phosphorylase
MLRWLLQTYLQEAARQKIYEAAQEQLRAASADAQCAAQEQCDVAIVFDQHAEMVGMLDRLEEVRAAELPGCRVYRGRWRERSVAVAVPQAQDAPAQAAATAEAVIAGHQPQWVIAAGFSTALRPEVRRGDIVVADKIVSPGARPLRLGTPSTPEAPPGKGVWVGGVLCSQIPPQCPSERQVAGQAHDALATAGGARAVALTCAQAQLPCQVVRVIHQEMAERRSTMLRAVAKQKSVAGKAGAVLGALLHRPSTVTEAWTQKEQSLEAADRLADFLGGLLVELTPRKQLKS